MAGVLSRVATVGLSAALFLGAAGCLHVGPSKQDVSSSFMPVEDTEKQELPPKEKAKVCMATAQQEDMGGKANEAIALYERARALDSKYNRVCRRLAVLYDRFGNFVKADEEYAKAIAMFPKDAGVLNDAGYSHYCRGDWTIAEDYLRQAVELKPDFKGAWVNLGMTLAQRDRVGEAMEAFSHAVAEPEAHCNIAFVYMSKQKFAEAAAEYRKALALAPDLKLAREALAKLENPGQSTKVVAAGANERFATTRE